MWTICPCETNFHPARSRQRPRAVRRGRLGMRDMGLGESFAFAQTEVMAILDDPDFDESIAAFNEKRPPRWNS